MGATVNERAQADVVSGTPGRLRVRLHRPHRQAGTLQRVHAQLHQQPGVSHVRANSRTGSVTVKYDPHQVSEDDVLVMLKDVGVTAERVAAGLGELPDAGPSTGATSVVTAVNDLDRRLSLLTGRKVDLKLLVPASLFGLGLRQTLAEGLGIAQVPGYLLLWYAFDSFWKFHHEQPVEGKAGRKEVVEPVGEVVEARSRPRRRVSGADNG